MNMVQSRHKRVFVSPPSRDYSHPATASQSGSKWPKGSRPKKKKKHPNLCSTMVHANHSPHSLAPTLGAHPLLVHPSKPEFLLRAVWSLFTEVSVKSAELHTFHMFIRGDKERISEKYMNRTNDWLGMDEEDFFFFFFYHRGRASQQIFKKWKLFQGGFCSVRPDPSYLTDAWLIDTKGFISVFQ